MERAKEIGIDAMVGGGGISTAWLITEHVLQVLVLSITLVLMSYRLYRACKTHFHSED